MAPVLGYWNIRGLASQIRYQLAYAGVEYTEDLYNQGPGPEFDRSEWLDKKFTLDLDFPNLPYFIDGDFRFTETAAIMRYIANKWCQELNGSSPEENALIDMVYGPVLDLKQSVTMPCYYSGDISAVRQEISKRMPSIVQFLGNKNFLVGDNVKWIDFFFFELVDFCLFLSDNTLFNDFPALEAYQKRVQSLPRLQEFWNSEQCIKRPFNNTIAKINN